MNSSAYDSISSAGRMPDAPVVTPMLEILQDRLNMLGNALTELEKIMAQFNSRMMGPEKLGQGLAMTESGSGTVQKLVDQAAYLLALTGNCHEHAREWNKL